MNNTKNNHSMVQDGSASFCISNNAIIRSAIKVLKTRISNGELLNCANSVADYLTIMNHRKDKERFLLVSLDSRLKVISCDTISTGTVKDAYIHPRKVVTMAIKRNASACILSHNHPSGHLMPSQADHKLTRDLVTVLDGIDINVLDHIITANGNHYSFAENGVLPRP